MKKLATVMIAVGAVLSGCVAIPYSDGPSYSTEGRTYDGRTYSRDGSYYGYRTYSGDGAYSRDGSYDRDRDGVSNRQDRYPNDARRY